MSRRIYDLNTSNQTYSNLHEFPMWTDWNADYLQILEKWTFEKRIEDLSNQVLKTREILNQIHEKMASWGRKIEHLILESEIEYLRRELLKIRKRHRLLQISRRGRSFYSSCYLEIFLHESLQDYLTRQGCHLSFVIGHWQEFPVYLRSVTYFGLFAPTYLWSG